MLNSGLSSPGALSLISEMLLWGLAAHLHDLRDMPVTAASIPYIVSPRSLGKSSWADHASHPWAVPLPYMGNSGLGLQPVDSHKILAPVPQTWATPGSCLRGLESSPAPEVRWSQLPPPIGKAPHPTFSWSHVGQDIEKTGLGMGCGHVCLPPLLALWDSKRGHVEHSVSQLVPPGRASSKHGSLWGDS